MGLFDQSSSVPVWFMRQAGRYHQHYQEIKKESDFMSMCKTPELACEITLGPLRAFGFDGAILFSDLLFPLEQLGMDLVYNPGPRLGFHLQSAEDLKRLNEIAPASSFYDFQTQALKLLKGFCPGRPACWDLPGRLLPSTLTPWREGTRGSWSPPRKA